MGHNPEQYPGNPSQNPPLHFRALVYMGHQHRVGLFAPNPDRFDLLFEFCDCWRHLHKFELFRQNLYLYYDYYD